MNELPYYSLSKRCDPDSLGFRTTDELPDLQNVIGQPRALRALALGSEVSGSGYNIFVLGYPGSGRTTLSQEYLERKATGQRPPDDWVYVNNFDNPRSPRSLRMPAGMGNELRRDFEELVVTCQRELPQAFESEEYTQERDRLVSDLKKVQEAEFNRLQEHVARYQFVLVRAPFGIVLVPAVGGKPLSPDDVKNLTDEQRTKVEQLAAHLSEEVDRTLGKLRQVSKETAEKLVELDRRTALFRVQPLMDALRKKYQGLEGVQAHLDAAQADITVNAARFRTAPAEQGQSQASEREWTLRYQVNLLVDNRELQGAPVIVESSPTYQNLLGRIEHEVVMGGARTDFTMIRPGALHRSNGGYLLVPARDLLINPYAWEGLKRVLRDGCIRIVDLGSQLGLLSTITLEPEPIPLETKIVLIGTPLLYYLLRAYDEDFAKLFKVRAEFATLMERNAETDHEYALFIRSVVDDNHLPPFDATAVARIIEFSARLAEDQNKLSTRFGLISDLVREAAHWATSVDRHAGDTDAVKVVVSAEHVQRAMDEEIYRSNYLEERIQELITQDTLLIDTEGTKVGQVNALSVIQLGDYSFGRPSRVTASVHPGQAGVIDIEQQAQLGGPIHTKGVLILSGFLGHRYGQKHPLNLSASLAFEQSYEGVEGDSASAAELLALVSALAGIPLRQDRAITGSINQHGQIQAVGGVNEKIEGFFAVCRLRGLTGEQGVILPAANVRNLMLKPEVVQAVEEGKFHIWPIMTVEEGIELLSDQPAGVQRPDGSYPAGTFNAAVFSRLVQFARAVEKKKTTSVKKRTKQKS